MTTKRKLHVRKGGPTRPEDYYLSPCANEDRNGPPSTKQGISTAEPKHGQAASCPDSTQKNQEGVWQHAPCPSGIQSVTQLRVHVYTCDNWRCAQLAACCCTMVLSSLNHGSVSVLCLVCGSETLAHEQKLPHTNTMKDNCDQSSSCSHLISIQVQKQKQKLLLPLSPLATPYHTE